MNRNLKGYIKSCREKGFSNDQIKQALLKAGWDEKTCDSNLLETDFFGAPEPDAVPTGQRPAKEDPKEKTSLLSILALIFAFVAPLVGIIIGIAALQEIKKSNEKGKGIAIAAIVVGIILFVLILLLVITVFALPFFLMQQVGDTAANHNLLVQKNMTCAMDVNLEVLADRVCITKDLSDEGYLIATLTNNGFRDVSGFRLYLDDAIASHSSHELNRSIVMVLKMPFETEAPFNLVSLRPQIEYDSEMVECNANNLIWDSSEIADCNDVDWEDRY